MNSHLLRVLHVLCAIILPLALVLLISCTQAHEQKAPLGDQFDPQKLNDALLQATGGATISNLQKNQMVHYEESARIDNNDPDLHMSTHILNVLDRHQDAATDSLRITYHHSNNYRDENGNWQDIETEDTYDIPNANAVSVGLLMSSNEKQMTSLSQRLKLQSADQPTRITYHNLNVSEADIAPPDTIKNKVGCGGIANCSLHVTYVAFDEVHWSDDVNYTKISWHYSLTSQLPYIDELWGVMVERCAGFSAVQESKTHHIEDCQYLTDLQM